MPQSLLKNTQKDYKRKGKDQSLDTLDFEIQNLFGLWSKRLACYFREKVKRI